MGDLHTGRSAVDETTDTNALETKLDALLIQLKIVNKHLSMVTNEILTEEDIETD